jgi:hypothetical protein
MEEFNKLLNEYKTQYIRFVSTGDTQFKTAADKVMTAIEEAVQGAGCCITCISFNPKDSSKSGTMYIICSSQRRLMECFILNRVAPRRN